MNSMSEFLFNLTVLVARPVLQYPEATGVGREQLLHRRKWTEEKTIDVIIKT